jgi:aminopeptidase N
VSFVPAILLQAASAFAPFHLVARGERQPASGDDARAASSAWWANQGGTGLAVMDDRIRSDQDILHYRLAVEIPDSGRAFRASVAIHYAVRGGQGPLVLDFDSVFVVDSVQAGGGRLESGEERRGEARRGVSGWRLVRGAEGWELRVPHWGNPGDTLEVVIGYHGRPRDGLFIQPNVHGERTAFADNWPNRARYWFPAADHPSDKATVAFDVSVPAGWRVIANGAAAGVDTLRGESGRTRWRWVTRRPIPTYTMVIGAGPMAVTSLGDVAGAEQSVWTFRQDSAFAVEGPFRRARDMVEAYSRMIGPFPYEKLAHVQASTRFGGMENSSAIFYAERSFRQRSLTESTVAHEIAHQWFGDAVTERDWHHLWLSEGFASYLEPLFFEQAGELPAFRASLEGKRRVYLASDVVGRPVIDTTVRDLFDLLNANNYSKGAWILHMLRTEMGDSAFFDGLRAYYRGLRDSTALSSDFAAVMERYSAKPLEAFFRQWLLQPGYPRLEVRWRYNGGALALDVEQTQPEGWGLFELSLPVRVELEPGRRLDRVVPLTGRKDTIEWDVDAMPVSVVVDPEATLLLEAVVRRAR